MLKAAFGRLQVWGVLLTVAATIIGCPPPPGITLYGDDATDEDGKALHEMPDGGFLLAGYSTTYASFDSYHFDPLVVRTERNGNILWERRLSDSENRLVKCAAFLEDGGVVLGGDWLGLARLDGNGDILWERTSPGPAHAMEQTDDGGFVLAGSPVYLMKLSANGETEWTNFFGSTFNRARGVTQTQDGGFVMCGMQWRSGKADGVLEKSKYFPGGDADVFLLKTDDAGNLAWSKTFKPNEGSSDDEANALVETRDGGFAFGGMARSTTYGNGDAYLLRTDSEGELLWEAVFGFDGEQCIEALVEAQDGSIVVSGYSTGYDHGPYMAKVSSDGVLQWQKKFPVSGTAFDIIETSGGGFALCGRAYRASDKQMVLIRTNADGNLLQD